MENWRKDARSEAIIVDLEALVPQDHLLRKIEKVMDYEWMYERLDPYYCHDNGRPGTDPVVLIKMVLIQRLFGNPSLRQTHREIQVNLAYRWFLGYGLLDEIPHFATVSYAFCKRFPEELAAVTRWVRLKYAAMNLKKLANWSWNNSFFSQILLIFTPKCTKTPVFT